MPVNDPLGKSRISGVVAVVPPRVCVKLIGFGQGTLLSAAMVAAGPKAMIDSAPTIAMMLWDRLFMCSSS
jgi:hypothetical protein